MDFHRHIRVFPVARTGFVPFINLILLVVVFFVLVLSLTEVAPLAVKLPRGITSDMVNDGQITIMVTSENILYIHEKVTTLQELKQLFSRSKNKTRSVLIKADRRASVGRIVDIWDLGRNSGIERINVAADQGE